MREATDVADEEGRRVGMPQATHQAPAGSPITVFISAYRGFTMRYIVHSGVLKQLANRDVRVVLFVKDGDVPHYSESHGGPNVDVRPILYGRAMKQLKGNRLQVLLVLARKFMSGGKDEERNTTDEIWTCRYADQMRRGWLHPDTWLFCGARTLAWCGRRVRSIRQGLVMVEGIIFRGRMYDQYFAEYRPRLLVVSSLGYMIDPYIMRAARRWNCRIVSVIHNWDNPTTKDYRGCVPDDVIVWNDPMKREVNILHDIPADRIHVGGIAHWDFYFNGEYEAGSPREFAGRYGLDEKRRTLFYVTSNFKIFPYTFDVIQELLSAISEERLFGPCQLLVRLHPNYLARRKGGAESEVGRFLSRMRELELAYQGLVAFALPDMNVLQDDIEMPAEDMHELARCIGYSDVVLTEYSTVMIEASILDKPVVNVGLHPLYGLEALKSVEELTHIRRILRFGATRNAHTFEELIEFVNKYLEAPEKDRENRRSLVDHMVTTHRGTAAKNVAAQLLRMANEPWGGSS